MNAYTQVWSVGQPTPNFTLEGHEKGVNCVDYFVGGARMGQCTLTKQSRGDPQKVQQKIISCSHQVDLRTGVQTARRPVSLGGMSGHLSPRCRRSPTSQCLAGDRPFLLSGADDRLAKVWDYQTKACVQTLEGHAHNVSAVMFHPELPVILTGCAILPPVCRNPATCQCGLGACIRQFCCILSSEHFRAI